MAPRLSTCSLTAGRTSKASTTAPSRRAVAIAWRPATPAPSTSALAGRIVPAAVVNMGRNLGRCPAAMRTALYPATVAWEESASIDWARVILGTSSMEIEEMRRSASLRMSAGSPRGSRKDTRIEPSARPETSSGSASDGGLTRRTMPASRSASAALGATVAPDSRKASSSMPAESPAPASIDTSMPAFTRAFTPWGTRATLRSPARVSLRTATFMRLLRCRTKAVVPALRVRVGAHGTGRLPEAQAASGETIQRGGGS